MKKLSFLLLALLLTLSSFAQLDRAYMMQVAKYNEIKKEWVWGTAQDINLRFTMETNFIKINDNYGTKLWTYEDLGQSDHYDDDGDPYSKHSWLAYDEKNRKCKFMMLWYTTPRVRIVTYTIQYSDIAFRYYISNN